MSQFTTSWSELYSAQTESVGVAIVATITGYATSKPAVLTEVNLNQQIIDGGYGENGGFELQMLQSDLSAEPPQGTAVTCNGAATGTALKVISTKLNNAVWYITAGDFSVEGQ